MRNYQSTAAQARFADSLAQQLGDTTFADAYAKAARLNGNREWAPTGAETRIQAVRRLSKKAASALIDDLLAHTN